MIRPPTKGGELNLEVREYAKATGFFPIPKFLSVDLSLTIYDKVVYGVLLSFVRPKGHGNCYPSVKRIAAEANISERQVARCLRHLKARYWIDSFDDGRGNIYLLRTNEEHEAWAAGTAAANQAHSRDQDRVPSADQWSPSP